MSDDLQDKPKWIIEQDEDGYWIQAEKWSLVGRGETLEQAAHDLEEEARAAYEGYANRVDLSEEAKKMVAWIESMFDVRIELGPPEKIDRESYERVLKF